MEWQSFAKMLIYIFFQMAFGEGFFKKNCGWGNTPGLSFFWRPPVVVEQNYPPVHPVMIPGRSLEVHPVRVAIFRKKIILIHSKTIKWRNCWLSYGLPCQSKQHFSQRFLEGKWKELFSLVKAILWEICEKSWRNSFSHFVGQIGSRAIWELDAKWGRGTFKILTQLGDIFSRYSTNWEIFSRY